VAQLFGGQRWCGGSGSTRQGLEVEEGWLLQGEGLISAVRVAAGVDCNSATTASRCCGGGKAIRRGRCAAPRRGGQVRFARLRMKILLGLRSEPVMTTPAGVATSLEASSRSAGASQTYSVWCLRGENLDRFVRSAMAASLTSFLS
jgi:hypothetical protein